VNVMSVTEPLSVPVSRRISFFALTIGLVVFNHGCTDVPPTFAPSAYTPTNPTDGPQTPPPGETAPINQIDDEPNNDRSIYRDVKIVFSKPEYSFTLQEATKGVSIEYQIVVDRDVSGIVPLPQDVGHAFLPGPSGLIPFEELSGNGHRYRLSDVGLGDIPSTTPTTIKQGSYSRNFTWDGRNWSGPSDYGHPKGAPFPAGDYALHVSCIGHEVLENSKPGFTIQSSVRVRLKE
jgi:hypothetical protein